MKKNHNIIKYLNSLLDSEVPNFYETYYDVPNVERLIDPCDFDADIVNRYKKEVDKTIGELQEKIDCLRKNFKAVESYVTPLYIITSNCHNFVSPLMVCKHILFGVYKSKIPVAFNEEWFVEDIQKLTLIYKDYIDTLQLGDNDTIGESINRLVKDFLDRPYGEMTINI